MSADNEEITRAQKVEGADTIMDRGFITERDEPGMMDHTWCEAYCAALNDELRLRSLPNRVILQKFNYYMGDGMVIYDQSRLTEADAKRNLRYALGYHK